MSKRSIYLKNTGWIKDLRDGALNDKRFLEAYLLTFFRIELALILMIDLRMTTTGKIEYSDEFYKKIKKGHLRFSELINLFCMLYGSELFHALDLIRKERNNFVHNFFKKPKVDFEEYVKDLCTGVMLVENEIAGMIHNELNQKNAKSKI